MKLKHILGNPFLLRRLVRSHERIAEAIEDIRNHYVGSGTVRILDADDTGTDISYTRDRDTWEYEQRDRDTH